MPPTNRLPSEPDSPAAGAAAGQDASALWLVSFGDEDDRELVASQIATALRKGEIDGTTIVWRDGLPDWLPIASVPTLAALIPQGGDTTTAPIAISNIAPEPKAAPTEDVTTAPGLGDAGDRKDTAATAKPVAKIVLKPSAQPKPSEDATTAKPAEATVDANGKPAWRGKTKIGLPKVEVQKPDVARRLEPVKPVATSKAETAPKPATATPRPAATAKPAATTGLGAKATEPAKAAAPAPEAPRPAAIAAPQPAAAPDVTAPAADEPEPVTMKPSDLAAAAALKAEIQPLIPEHSPEAPTAKLPEVVKAEPRKPPLPPNRPPIRNTIAGVGVMIGTTGNAGAEAKPAPKPPARGGASPGAREPFVSPRADRDRESRPPMSARAGTRGAANIWDNDDEEPVSVDPSYARPAAQTPSPNIAKATALSSGTLGLSRKPAPKPPTPKGAPKPPAPAPVDLTPGTPSLQALSAPLSTRTEGERVDDLLHLESAPAKVGTLSPNTFAPPAPTPVPPPPSPAGSVEDLPSDILVEADDAQPTTPFGLDAPLEALTRPPAPAAAPKTPHAAPATPSSPPTSHEKKKRSLVPFFALGALAALAISVGIRQLGSRPSPEPAPVEQPQASRAPAPAGEPAPAPEIPGEPPKAAEPAPEPPAAKPDPAAVKPSTPVVGGEPAPKQVIQKGESAPRPAPAEKAEPAAKRPAPAAPEKAVDMGGEFDRSAAAAAMGAAATAAAGCRKEGDPSGLAVVKVTFTNSGKATRAVIEGPPFAGTATGGCIAAQMRAAKVPPFGGDRVTVTKRVVIQ